MKKSIEFKRFMRQVLEGPTVRGMDDSIARGSMVVATKHGLEGKKMPNLGELSASELLAVNSAYEAMRDLRSSFGVFDET